MNEKWSFFSVRHDLVQVDQPLAYDLFINSSIITEKEKFIRIFPQGGVLKKEELHEYHLKYTHLYVSESQRQNYLKSLVHSNVDEVTKTSVIKSAALDYLHQIFDKEKEFSTDYLSQNIKGCKDVVGAMVDVLDKHSIDSLRGLIANLSFHDFYTFDHSINVSMYCITIYKTINPGAKKRELIHAGLGGLLHDLGKVKIPTHVLNNPGNLSSEEYQLIKKHPVFGIDLLLNGEREVDPEIDIGIIARIVHEHHENFDGTGYPSRLKGREQIHLLARICSIADFFDAITTQRSYNEILSIPEAMNTMRKFRGTKLDPDIFDFFDRHVQYVRTDLTRDLKLADSFDPTLPYVKLPMEEVKQFGREMDYGKIKYVDSSKDKKKG